MQQVHTAKTRRLSRATSAHSGDEHARDDRTRYGSCRDDRRHYGSCRRVRRPDALRKLSVRETIALKKGPRATSAISAETSAERDQWRELPDEPSTSRFA